MHYIPEPTTSFAIAGIQANLRVEAARARFEKSRPLAPQQFWRVAVTTNMAPRKRVQTPHFALTSDGTLLVNLAAPGPGWAEDGSAAQSVTDDPQVFVGVPLTAKEAASVLERLDHAGAEAAALILSQRRRAAPKHEASSAKEPPSRAGARTKKPKRTTGRVRSK